MTNTTEIAFSWDVPSEDGGISIIDYYVEEKMTQSFSNDDDDDGFYFVANVTEPSYNKTDNIISGATYQYRVKARNEVGYGDYSSVISIIAAT